MAAGEISGDAIVLPETLQDHRIVVHPSITAQEDIVSHQADAKFVRKGLFQIDEARTGRQKNPSRMILL
ncbi:hypothetical protein U9M48_001961 [Paspalum notatum var. saurae]|uniref:Uncharacterized protein n=1 Tax=Paspalum notatum var. saurae TaxID=547442 RepID=A0AAQ3PQF7_PASNO